ncbi:methyltransferase domain-containing protein [Aquabacter sp. L1I39]|uniref:protein-L-isoaspartate O-methyltransferase family protein n=1 Tax=Aquabacter sp. L1I39 TaxID=2820278 RepID=UPI001ADC03B6|nr:methyltransferase domain-containing protein [Aquabacter sp. L1I39]QTL01578.1 methyltransferase domain-containing protein [Aquabacter sp. L1I39]
MIDFAELRRGMVDGQVRTNDVTDLRIVEAMMTIPRERFVPGHLKSLAYIDDDLQVRSGKDGTPPRFLVEPMVLAKLVQLADVQPDELVLDVGCTTGYSSAVLASLSGQVVALDDDADFVAAANATLTDLGLANVAAVMGPMNAGWAAEAPYDLIFLNGSMEVVPPALVAQLKDGGRLVGVVGHGGAGRAAVFTKVGESLSERVVFNAAIPLLPGFAAPARFTF